MCLLHILNSYNQTSSILYFNYKHHRITHKVLLASRSDGGLAIPNLLKYYQAAQLCAFALWSTQYAYNKWSEIEKLWLAPVHPNNLLLNVNVDPNGLLRPRSHKLLPFDALQDRIDLPRQVFFFGYLQIRHYAQTITTTLKSPSPLRE